MNIEKRLHELRQISDKYAKAKAEAEYLDHFRKSKLSMLMSKYKKDYKTTAAQEREARQDTEYLEILQGLRVAVEKSERLGWELKIAMKGADLWQTHQANLRHEKDQYKRA